MQCEKNIRAGKLEVNIYGTRADMGKAAAQDGAARIRRIIKEKGSVNAVFAAAPSQNELLEELLSCDVDWMRVRAFHLDEYIGLPADAPQGFGNFLNAAIFSRVSFMEINYINGQAADPEEECRRYTRLLEQFPPDIVFLGVGENGHLAFNDPPVADFNDPKKVKIVDLDEVCRNQQVNDGCFSGIEMVPLRAFSLTIPVLFRIPEVIVVVPGATKREALTHTVRAEISTRVPSTILRNHDRAVLYADAESGADLI